jgi:hypothetical protein
MEDTNNDKGLITLQKFLTNWAKPDLGGINIGRFNKKTEKMLKDFSFLSLTFGKFDEKTEELLIAYQTSKGLKAD